MFLILVCVIVVALLGAGSKPDIPGWMMLLGASWVAGYLDCRMLARSDQDRERVLPPDVHEESNDATLFHS